MEIFSLFGSIGIKGASEVKAKLQETSKEADKTAKDFNKSTNDSSRSSSSFLSKIGSGFTGAGNVIGGFVTSSGQKMVSFGKNMQSNGQAMKDFGNIAQPAFKLAAIGVAAVSGAILTGVKRFDTLNNAARSFENMGVAKGVITKEMNNLKAAIEGLPTPLDDAVSSTQMLTSTMNGDMSQSVKVYKALNDGILGFGGSSENVKTAVVQLSQGFANNKVGGQEWLSMMNNGLGPALNAMAKNMGITTGELKDGLSEGNISVEEFQNQLIRLDKEGGGGMKSLSKIAADSTKGIGTSFANLKTSIAKFGAEILAGLGDRPQKAIEAVRDKVAELATKAKPAAEQFVQVLDRVWPVVEKLVSSLQPLVPIIIPVISAFAGFSVVGGIMMKMGKTTELVGNLLKTTFKEVNGVMKMTSAGWLMIIITLITAFVSLYASNKDFRDKVNAIVEQVKTIFSGMKGSLEGVFNNLKSIFENGKKFVSDFLNGLNIDPVEVFSDGLDAIAPIIQFVIDKLQGVTKDVANFLGKLDGAQAAKDFKSTLEGIKKVLDFFSPLIAGIVGAFVAYNTIQAISAGITAVTSGAMAIYTGVTGAAAAVTGALASAVAFLTSPIGIVVAVIGGLIAIGVLLYKNWDKITEVAKSVWGSLSSFFSKLWSGISKTFNDAIESIKSTWNGITNYFTDLMDGVSKKFNEVIESIKSVWNDVTNYFSKLWSDISRIFNDSVNSIVEFFSKAWNGLQDVIKTVFEGIRNVIKTVMVPLASIAQSVVDTVVAIFKLLGALILSVLAIVFVNIANAVMSGLKVVIDIFNSAIDGWLAIFNKVKAFIVPPITAAFNQIKSIVNNTMLGMKAMFTNTWQAIVNFVQPILTALSSIISSIFNSIKNTVTSVFNTIKTVATNVWNAIKDTITKSINAAKITITNVVNAIKNTVTTVFNAVKTVAINVWNAIKDAITKAITAAKTTITNVVNAIKNTVSSVFNSVKASATNVWNGIKTTISNSINAAKNAVSSAINGIKGYFSKLSLKFPHLDTSMFTKAKDAIKSVVDAIKGFFSNLRLDIPKPKFPHVSVNGGKAPFGIGGKGSLPSFDVQWYAKGGIMENATAFGVNGNNLMVGGEAGREAILPLNKETLGQIGDQIVASTTGMGSGELVFNQYNYSPENLTPREAARMARKAGKDMVQLLRRK